jgi:glycosyltransferase involved in cell wall biosynthesis
MLCERTENSVKPLRIAYVGRLEREQKRIQDLSAIADELDRRKIDYELVIAGTGPDEIWLREQLSDATAAGRVRFVGTLFGRELAEQVYLATDVLLITSLWETGPIVAWEAMAHGLVVVTSAYLGSGRESSLRSGENCLTFPIGDAATAVDRLEALANPQLRAALRRGGISLVSSRYSTAVSVSEWDSCLRQVAERAPLPMWAGKPFPSRRTPAGRLDRLLGARVGESVREILGLRYRHDEPGGEWPHANVRGTVGEDSFWKLAKSLDELRQN